MARIRTIKPEFWQDEKMSAAPIMDRLVFLGLIGMADDCGRLLDNVKVIDAWVFSATDDTCADALIRLELSGRIRRGVTESSQKVIQIVNWDRHQKIDKPNLKSALPKIKHYNELPSHSPTPPLHVADKASNHTNDRHTVIPTTNDQRPTTLVISENWPARLAVAFNPVAPIKPGQAGKALKAAVDLYGPDAVERAIGAYCRDCLKQPPEEIRYRGPADFAKRAGYWVDYTRPGGALELLGDPNAG